MYSSWPAFSGAAIWISTSDGVVQATIDLVGITRAETDPKYMTLGTLRVHTARSKGALEGARSPFAGEGAPIWNFEIDGPARTILVLCPNPASMSRHDLSANCEYQSRTSGLGLRAVGI